MSVRDTVESALVESVQETFRNMLNEELEVTDSVSASAGNAELICTVGAAGKLEGSVSVSLPNSSACSIVSKMLQEKVTEISAEVCDGMCEVANMIAGGAKVRLAKQGYSYEISIPTVVLGQAMYLRVRQDVEKIKKCFKVDGFSFDVEFMFKINKAESASDTSTVKSVSKIRALENLKSMTGKGKV